MSVLLVLFAILAFAAAGIAIITINHVLEEKKKENEHEREQEKKKEKRVNKMLDE